MKLFIFGSTGDLVKRKVLSGLNSLDIEHLEIFALGRRNFDNQGYLDFVLSKEEQKRFSKKISYQKIEFSEDMCLACTLFLDRKETNYFYVSITPDMLLQIFNSLLQLKKKGFKIMALIEKPFGENLSNAENLALLIKKNNLSDEIVLSDHYLFKEKIIPLKEKRFSTLKIVSLEKIGIEKRAGFYDKMGALKDMIQSHFFNIAFKLLDSPENEFSDFNIEEYEIKQYEGYQNEIGHPSDTETYARLKIAGKTREFEFITGKAFDRKEGYVEIDGKRTDFTVSSGEYKREFENFFSGNTKVFPKIKESLLSWKIISEAEKEKPKLEYYKQGSKVENFS